MDYYAPYSYLCKNISEEQHQELLLAAEQIGDTKIVADDQIPLLNIQFWDDCYQPDENSSCGDQAAGYLISESLYLKIIHNTGAQYGEFSNLATDFAGKLAEHECYFIDRNTTKDFCETMPGSALCIDDGKRTQDLTVSGVSLHKYLGMIDGYQKATIVVNDQVYEDYLSLAKVENIETFYGISFEDEMGSQKIVDAFNQMIGNGLGFQDMPDNISYIEFYKKSFELYGAYVFIGVFMGCLFMLAIGSLMYYKQIVEAREEIPRYRILRKIGMSRKEIGLSIMKQQGIIFGLPLILGLLHTYFALMTYNRTMDLLGTETSTLSNAFMIVLIYVVVYGLFYVASVWNYYKTAQI
ncbi:MAG: ABC transporter permease [Clostridia bacterium]|nr:ABC transporter permease [Clostridia bacterium]